MLTMQTFSYVHTWDEWSSFICIHSNLSDKGIAILIMSGIDHMQVPMLQVLCNTLLYSY